MDEVPGHRVAVEVELRQAEGGGLTAAVEPGSRSLLFVFDDHGEDVRLGAAFEHVAGVGRPGEAFNATVAFWHDVAARYATPGARFTLWYGREVGSGKVVEVLADDG
ncbi:MAG TPA: hypothetical protein VF519_01105 [Mycobacteriales bacterium]